MNSNAARIFFLFVLGVTASAAAQNAGDEIALAQDRALYRLQLNCLASGRDIEGFEGDIDAPVESFSMMPRDDSDKGNSIALLLTYGSFSFFAGGDITWNLEHYLQTIQRVHRQGNKAATVVLHRLIAENTLDEVVVATLYDKEATQEEFLVGLRNYRQ